MNILELKEKFNAACEQVVKSSAILHSETFYRAIYFLMFGEMPHIIDIDHEGIYLNPEYDDYEDPSKEKEDCDYTEELSNGLECFTFEDICWQHTCQNLVEYFKNTAYIIRNDRYPIIIAEKFIFFHDTDENIFYIFSNHNYITDEIKNLIFDKKEEKPERTFKYVVRCRGSYSCTHLVVKPTKCDLNLNYNDDLPNDKIEAFIKSEEAGLGLIYGEPGTGKTTYLRHLMTKFKGRNFIVIDPSVLSDIEDGSLIELLSDNMDSVVIMEDCEDLLIDRSSGNSKIATLLNLSDGMIGDGFKIKFICTFNANVNKLDKAILRKGRLKFSYQFKKLTPEKTYLLGKAIGIDVPECQSLSLADIYNYNETTGYEDTKKGVGFGK